MKEDFDEVVRQIPSSERHQSPRGSLYSSPHYPASLDRRPLPRTLATVHQQCRHVNTSRHREAEACFDRKHVSAWGDATYSIRTTPGKVVLHLEVPCRLPLQRLRYGAEYTAKYGLAEALRLPSTWETLTLSVPTFYDVGVKIVHMGIGVLGRKGFHYISVGQTLAPTAYKGNTIIVACCFAGVGGPYGLEPVKHVV